MTHYTPGLGSCGLENSATDRVVALARAYMASHEGANPNLNTLCGNMIQISYNGKTSTAKVVDTCYACEGMSIDVSDPVFEDSADLGAIPPIVSWNWA
jgi:hypothetical protein